MVGLGQVLRCASNIEPGFTIHAQLMRLEHGERETLAEWPPIKNVSDRE